jgi:hypothetical protein
MSFEYGKVIRCAFNDSDAYRLTVLRYKMPNGGKSIPYINIRVLYKNKDGEEKSSKQGICLTYDEFRDYFGQIELLLAKSKNQFQHQIYGDVRRQRRFNVTMDTVNFSMTLIKKSGVVQAIMGPTSALRSVLEKKDEILKEAEEMLISEDGKDEKPGKDEIDIRTQFVGENEELDFEV